MTNSIYLWVYKMLHKEPEINVDQICRWSAISLSLVTHAEVNRTVLTVQSSDSCSELCWNQLPRIGVIA